MRRHLEYLKYIARHKLLVYREGRRLKLGVARCLLHDWQKLTPAEFGPYLDAFYGDDPKPKTSMALAAWEMREGSRRAAFDRAWLHHQRAGSAHHWQSHVLLTDDGGEKPLPMPDADRREMLADWRAMGRMFGEEPPAVGWYLKNREKMRLHPETREWVEDLLL